MIYHWTVERIIKELFIKHNIDATIKWTPTGMYNPMSYNVNLNLLKFNHYQLTSLYEKRYIKLMIEDDFVRIVTIHEIGHYLDYKKNPHKREVKVSKNDLELRIEREVAAWSYGRKLVPASLVEYYDMLNAENLMKYYKKKEMLNDERL